MSMLDFWKSLLPSFGQDRVIDDIARIRDSATSLVESLVHIQRAINHKELKSAIAATATNDLKKVVDMRADVFVQLHDLYLHVPTLMDVTENWVEEQFGKDVVKEALTYRKATVLAFLESISFSVDYATKFANRLLFAEIVAVDPNVPDNATEAQKKFLDEKYRPWLSTLPLLQLSKEQLVAKLNDVPDVTIDAKTEHAVEASVGKDALDPFKLNLITPRWNPIYRVRMVLAEWDVAKLEQSKEERKLVELRLRQLKQVREGKPDAALDHAIEVVEDRLKKLDFKIDRLSGHVG